MTDRRLPARGAVPVRRPELEWVELDGEVVVYDPGRARLHRLNVTAASVWSACDGTATIDDVIGATLERYAEPQDEIPGAVRDVLAAFWEEGLPQSPDEDPRPTAVPANP